MQPEKFSALVRRIQDSDTDLFEKHDAFGELVTRFQDMAYGYAYSILGNRQAAQDAAQDAFLIAYQDLEQLRDPAAFPAWLRRIVASHCSHLVRDDRTAAQGLRQDRASDESDLSALVESRELQERVMAAIHTLPEHERTTTILYYINGYSQREVAAFLEVSVDAVKKRLERARRQLMQEMLDIVGEQLMEGRPSQNERFIQEIRLSLEAAALEAQLAQLEPLLLDGMDVNATNSEGQTLLHWAAQRGHLEAVRMLLQYGADASIRDRAGKAALQLAREKGHHAAVELLQRAMDQKPKNQE